jgi:hypothetical protein
MVRWRQVPGLLITFAVAEAARSLRQRKHLEVSSGERDAGGYADPVVSASTHLVTSADKQLRAKSAHVIKASAATPAPAYGHSSDGVVANPSSPAIPRAHQNRKPVNERRGLRLRHLAVLIALVTIGIVFILNVWRNDRAVSTDDSTVAATGEATREPVVSTGRAPPAATELAPNASRSPSPLVGVAEVVDTATLRLNGALVHLFGVEAAAEEQTDNFARYLSGREVSCVPADRPETYRCYVEGRDLSQVVLFNGGGRAAADASPELSAAEARARAARTGLWR